MADIPRLVTLGEKTLPQAADPDLVTYCPSMDLIAVGTTDQQVLIYRLNGQRVYGAAQKSQKLTVEGIKWKPNGQLLAVAWSDGSVRLVGAESTKIVHQFSTGEGVSGITCMGWGSNVTNKTSNLRKGNVSWHELLSSDAVISEDNTPLDLPRDLSMIDIERSLPKLSLLAAGGASDDVFCSRSSLDALFRPFDPKDNNSVDIMVVGTNKGDIHLAIYDSFVVGSFSLPKIAPDGFTQLIRHSSHSQSSTHSLLLKSEHSNTLYLAALDIRFITATSDYLSLLASRSTALQNLLRYIHQVQMLMTSEWKSTYELPGRFLRNINETLKEKEKGDIVQALYHSVATGHTFPVVKEWLVDELAERGLKRWEKAVVTGLESLRRLVHENMIPALERCSVILSRFAGIAKFQGTNDTVGFSSKEISNMMDTVACLHLVASKILIQVVDELDLFSAFAAWLRYEIDRLAADSSIPKDDELEKEASLDHAKVLLYLQSCMMTSPLGVYLGDHTPNESKTTWGQAEKGVCMFELLCKQIEKQEHGLPYMKTLPRVELLCKHLSDQAKEVFSQIAKSEKRNVVLGNPIQVGYAEESGIIDLYMTTTGPSAAQTYVAFVPKNHPSSIQVTRVSYAIEGGLSKVENLDSSAIKLGDGRITDLKAIDKNSLLVLWELNGTTHLLTVPFKSTGESPTGAFRMEYLPHAQNTEIVVPASFTNEEAREQISRYELVASSTFVPERLEVRNRVDRRNDLRRVVVLGRDKHNYKILAFPKEVVEGVEKAVGVESDGDVSMSSGS